MFNFLFQDKNGKIDSYIDIITADIANIEISKAAIAKGINMISNAVAKSEICVLRKSQEVYDEAYYLLNVKPNPNECGTEFWYEVAHQLISSGECKICRIGNSLYRIESCGRETDDVMTPKKYEDLTLICAGSTVSNISVDSNDIMVFRLKNEEILSFARSVCGKMNHVVDSFYQMQAIANTPKFKMKINAATSFRDSDTGKVLTLDDYIKRTKSLLSADEMQIFKEPNGIELEQIEMKSAASAGDIATLTKEINQEAARSLNIPDAVFFGNITEKSDASNEFITYAVSPVVECLNDVIIDKMVGEKSFLNGERIFISTDHFKHVDLIDSASSLDKLRGVGYSFDELRKATGSYALNTDFSTARALTLNYAEEGRSKNEA